jgi:hypothetical protein
MTLEHLPDGSPDSPLLRLSDFTPAEADWLRAAVAGLAAGAADRVEVHRLPFVHATGGCRLTFVRRAWDQAVVKGAEPGEFECGLTADTWYNVAGLVDPFTESASGFQWLVRVPGEAGLLLSAAGEW